MSHISSFEALYQPFFDANNWQAALWTSSGWLTILTLAVLECLLSVDNAVVLAAQTQGLPNPKQQRHALLYGMGGAYAFRFVAIGLGTYLMRFWLIKAAGAAYLLWLSLSYFYQQRQPQTDPAPIRRGFWRTVVTIEFLDMVFSIDSVIAALGVSANPVIVLIGGFIGILAMRFVAQIITNFISQVPELEIAAYVLIGIISVKLALSLPWLNFEIPNWAFSLIVVLIFGVTGVVHWRRTRRNSEN
ncbi:TerC family protein [Lacticaseibacillus brantae]|uniref:Uncharacterized protein n=1 Tax=Lacticaseibacillus brantae DSM 23927 TaxID=1423727 RepID=A0A0R2B1W5_9LACO|nr:TerC family protein [Lacticaseibacillus brantae]KRM72754.1 hypothetical protein FC34_GL000464 [Lacticaseibacillus brantae DSM 23927]